MPIEPSWPVPDRRMYYGPAGRFVRSCEKHTEADPPALLACVLTYAGLLAAGQGYAIRAGNSWHPPLLFTNLLGRSAGSRKGTASAPVEAAVVLAVPAIADCLAGGFGSGQALVDHIAEHPWTLIREDELGAMLRNAASKGSILGQTYRKAWDGRPLEVRSRTGGVKVVLSTYYLAAIGHITLPELRSTLTSIDIFGGTVNRQLWVATKRSKVLANLGNVPDDVIVPFAKVLKRLDSITNEWYPGLTYDSADPASAETSDDDDDDGAQVTASRWKEPDWTPAAVEFWQTLYGRHCRHDEALGLLGHVIARGDVQMLRIALVYMLLDETTTLDVPHLVAAAAFWTYCRDTAAHAFGISTGDQRLDKVLAAIHAAGDEGLPHSAIRTDVLGSNNVKAETIDTLMKALDVAVYSVPSTTAGRSSTRWFVRSGGALQPLLDPEPPPL